ncbi:hypothetical protein D3C86_1097880 [compost metagenome]
MIFLSFTNPGTQGSRQCVHNIWLLLELNFFTIHDLLDIWKASVSFCKSFELNCCTFTNRTSNHVVSFINIVINLKIFTYERPGTWSWESKIILGRIEAMQSVLLPVQETNNNWVNFIWDSPFFPVIQVCVDFKVSHTVCQRSRHFVCNTFIYYSVTCCQYNYVIWQTVLSNFPVKCKLISCSLYCWRGRRNFIQKKKVNNILGIIQVEDLWFQPLSELMRLIWNWDTTKVNWIEKQQPNVGENNSLAGIFSKTLCQRIANCFGLTNPWRAPKHYCWYLDTRRVQRFHNIDEFIWCYFHNCHFLIPPIGVFFLTL